MATAVVLAAAPALAEEPKPDAQIADPWEGANRGFYKFSMGVDRVVIAPIIHAYQAVLPDPVRQGVKNVIYNLDEPRTAANDTLQGRLDRAGATTARFVINSTIGLGGLFDVAGRTGLPGHNSDFGQTLGRYGVGTGPYIFVPFAGPSDVRDGFGRIVDAIGDPVAWVVGDLTTTFGQVRDGVRVLQARVDIDDQLRGLDRDFIDPYATLRSGFSQNRAFKVQEAQGQTAAAIETLPDFSAETGPAPTPAPPAKP
jgi:phospholipid-binding lipoprotein MlaA